MELIRVFNYSFIDKFLYFCENSKMLFAKQMISKYVKIQHHHIRPYYISVGISYMIKNNDPKAIMIILQSSLYFKINHRIIQQLMVLSYSNEWDDVFKYLSREEYISKYDHNILNKLYRLCMIRKLNKVIVTSGDRILSPTKTNELNEKLLGIVFRSTSKDEVFRIAKYSSIFHGVVKKTTNFDYGRDQIVSALCWFDKKYINLYFKPVSTLQWILMNKTNQDFCHTVVHFLTEVL